MKNVFYHLFVFVCMASNASPINNDSIQKWESIPQEEFMAYALGLKTKLGHKTTQVFTIQEAKKRPVAFYDNAWLYDFTIKEEGTKNIKLLCLNREAQILITNDNAWNNIFKRYPPLLLTEAAVLDFFTLTNTNVVTSKEDLPIDLKNKIHLPRIMFQSENTYTIQSFLKEGERVYLAIHKVDTKEKSIVSKGKSNLFLKKNHSSIGVSFNKTPLLYNRMGWVGPTPILSR